ncbi:LysR family transcriptional regulator [Azoarcus sp. TTM-91]|uniref:LysR substrate-binding domain-containing protein n=1 Tax=Azoarcus sp. TTM-91 TaxID=2691581 RepID=UPI00145F5D91|nr:LysR substrate-binding domain-containing protein [Azoarcus sp. TTM-91]NMG34213.1 LysR family transcriptional regulator [Azoarcus sp. TTM-91]
MEHSKLSLARRLKLQQLAIFDQVVESGSILAASKALFMTQPAVSKSIHELENHFGQPLFVRSKRGVRLTDFGQLLRRHCIALMTDLRYLADDLNAWSSGVSGQVIVGTLISASARLLPKAVVRLREMAPNVVVDVRVGSNDVMFPELARGQLDVVVGLLPASSSDPAFQHVPLYQERLCAVVGRRHPLATESTVEPRQLAELDWILPTPESQAMRSAEQFFERLGMGMPRRVVESVSITTNIGLLLESDMVALMPFTAAEQFVHQGTLSVLPLRIQTSFGAVGYTLALGRTPTPAVERLLMALREVSEDFPAGEG